MLTRNDKEFSCKRYDYMRNKHFYLLKNVYAKFSDCHSNVNPFCNDLSHNLSFWHLITHPIIDPNIETFPKDNILGFKT
jgi:hypothetical protein